MSLDKARAALDAARELKVDEAELDQNGLMPLQVLEPFKHLLSIAQVQIQLAQAESLEQIAVHLNRLAESTRTRHIPVTVG